MDELWSTAKEVGGWLIAGLVTVIGYFIQRDQSRRDRDVADHEERLRELEGVEHVTKGDISAVYERLNAIDKSNEERHTVLLRAVLERRK